MPAIIHDNSSGDLNTFADLDAGDWFKDSDGDLYIKAHADEDVDAINVSTGVSKVFAADDAVKLLNVEVNIYNE